MKLASLKQGRDGRLVVVSQDLTRATDAFFIVPTLQAALDDWERVAPRLADLAEQLEHGSVPSFRFHEHDCASPPAPRLPMGGRLGLREPCRARAPGPRRRDARLVLDRPADVSGRLGLRSSARATPFAMADEGWGIDFEAEIAVVTGDVPMGAGRAEAAAAIRLVVLVNDVSLRASHPGRARRRASASSRSKPSSALSPVAVTPDELGRGLGRRAGSTCRCSRPSTASSSAGRDAGTDMTFDFPTLIAHAAQDAAARRRHHRRFGHGVEQRCGRRSRPSRRRGRARLFLHCRAAHRRDAAVRRGRARRSCASATSCASR